MPDRFGRYELGELLGRGGMGEVFRAYDTVRDRVVAVKVLPAHLASDESFTARFRRESRLAAQLNEAHIIPIHDFGEIDDRLFIEMRLVEGQDLNAMLSSRGALNPTVAVEIIAQIASALDAAHERGLVHRDVKPSNILLAGLRVDPDHVPFAYLVDFGIARSVGQQTALTTTSGATVGTVAYMAPERIAGAPGDHRADVYALACVLYEALTGATPFGGEPFAMMYAHVHAPPPRAAQTAANIPPELDDVIVRGLAKAPEDRFESAGDFATAARAAVRATGATGPVPRSAPTEPNRPLLPADPNEAAPTTVRREQDTPTRIVSPPPPTHLRGDLAPAQHPPPRRSRRKVWIAASAVVLLGVAAGAIALLAGGGSTPKATPSVDPGPVAAAARSAIKPGGTMTWALTAAVQNFNPYTQDGNTRDTRTVDAPLLPTPFHFDATGTPSVDTDYFTSITETSADPMTIEYKINPKARWSDGSRISYADFAAQQAVLGAGGAQVVVVPGYDQIKSVAPRAAGDDLDVVVTFAAPFSDWQNLFAPLLPKSLTGTATQFATAWKSAPAVTAGPFRWNGTAAGGRYTVTRNPQWWGDRPELDSISFLAVAGQAGLVAAFKNKQVDYGLLTGARANQSASLARQLKVSARRAATATGFRTLAINTRMPPLNDLRVRQAIALATDRTAVARVNGDPKATALQNHFFNPGVPAYQATCGEYCTPNLAKAKALLAAAGWKAQSGSTTLTKNGTPLSLTIAFPSDTTYFSEAMSVATSVAAIGMDLQLRSYPGTQFPAKFTNGEFQLALFDTAGGRFPLSNLLLYYRYAGGDPTYNPNGAGSPAIDALLVRAQQAGTAAARDAATNAVSAALWSNAAYLPLYTRYQPALVTSTLVNVGAFGLADVRWADIGYKR